MIKWAVLVTAALLSLLGIGIASLHPVSANSSEISPLPHHFSPVLGIFGPEEPVDPNAPGTGDDQSPSAQISPRLDKPILPENPALADLGHQTWWGVCMACHGDAGQGLTDEWRSTAFGEDQNCWNLKCHGKGHPAVGFELPRLVPPAIGPGTLKRFVTADELHQYLYEKMPWWDPGSLSSQQAWELTAFILQRDGVLAKGQELDIENASLLPVHLPIRDTSDERGWQMVLFGGLALASVGLIALRTLMPARQPNGTTGSRPTFFHHLHPPTIPLPQARWRYTLGAGGLAVFLSLILIVTGILEMYFYVPTPSEAATSIQTITYLVPYGALVRGLHFWAAQALVIVAVIHLLRVVLTGSFVLPRRFNYLIGLALLVLVLFLDFTGYVLRWDEGIRWALMVGTNLLKTIPVIGQGLYSFVVGGDHPGAAALNRFYAWHIFGLTLILIVLGAWHIFRVRRDGGISAPPPELRSDSRRISRSELVRREVLAMVVFSAALVLVAALIPAPIEQPILDTPTSIAEEVQAPWFFLWIQQLLRHGDAFWMGVALPLGLLAVLIAIPYVYAKIPGEQRGRWLPRAAIPAALIVIAVVLSWLLLTLLEYFQR
jgi:quinol-cytochrome oxidoreductase complex cytochrome b subunit